MLYSKLFPKALKQSPKDAESANARFLVQGGFVHQEMAGVYSWLPLGLRVLRNVEKIIREEINALGAQELLLPALQPKENWMKTGRWLSLDVLFKLKSQLGGEVALGPTHEEIIYPLVKNYISSYQDLPVALYQIQNKYRDELRAKSGVLRGREFGMKDMYSFHSSAEDFEKFYEKSVAAYKKVFKRCGLEALRVMASGGTFSKISDEFQVVTPAGEDTIHYCGKCKIYYNAELANHKKCPEGHELEEGLKSIEVGNIFPLKSLYAETFGVNYLDKDGKQKQVIAGCYGMGTTRLVGAIVEANHDERGIIWPKEVAPFSMHLVALFGKDKTVNKKIESACLAVIARSAKRDTAISSDKILFDDRIDVSAGEKFAVSDLLGIPERVVISDRTLAKNEMEIKDRKTGKIRMEKI